MFWDPVWHGETAYTWWRHQMETFSALLAICAGNSPVTGELPTQSPVTRSFDVFFYLRLNKQFGKQSRGWWFETLSRPLWRHRNVDVRFYTNLTALSTPFEDLNVGCKMYTVLHLCIFLSPQNNWWESLKNKTCHKCYKIMLFIVISKRTKHMYFTVASHKHRDKKQC